MLSKCLNSHLHVHVRAPNYHHPTKIITPLKSLSFTSSPRLGATNHVLIERNTWKRIMAFDEKSNATSEDMAGEFGPEPDPTLTNDDLRPTTHAQRTLSGWEMASLWVGLVVGVPSYYLAGSLVDLGMAWWQGIATVVLANVILLAPLVLTGHAGTRYGIPFPVLVRSAFGVRGAHVPTLLRALVGCGWYGIETWIGGEAIFLLLPKAIKGSGELTRPVPWLGTSPLEFACFVVFWVAQLAIVLKGMDGIRELEKYSAPILIVLTSCLLAWSYVRAGGFGHMLSMSSRLSPVQFWSLFFPSLTANISFWATLALNIPDFTRYARSQSDQIVGQAGLPIFMGLFTFVGLAVTSSTEAIFGHVISSPIQLLREIGGVWTVALAIFGISLATFTTNIAANVVAPANALVNLNPSQFTFRTGALVTAILGVAFQPWRLLKSSESFIYTWLVGYSALLGPIGGIILADYYLVRKTHLKINDLYTLSPSGAYYYSNGFNGAALAALAIGILPVVPGFLQNVGFVQTIHKTYVVIYENAWFFSFFLAGLVYWFLMNTFQAPQIQQESASRWEHHEVDNVMDMFKGGNQLMVMNCYPPCPQPNLTLGMPPHSDYGFLKFLLQDKVKGLQVQLEEKWFTVDPVPGSFAVNNGNHIEIFSNGSYKSVLHRVLTNSARSRVSVDTIHSFPVDTTVRPWAEHVDEANPQRYGDTSFACFLDYIYSREPKKSFLESRKLPL